MKTCKVCGKAMDDGYAVCPYCGASLNTAPGEEQQQGSQTAGQYNMPPYGQPNQQYNGQPNQQYNQQYYNPQPTQAPEYTPAPKPQKSAYIAAILALFLGAYGVHNFYLDRKNKGITMLLITALASIPTFGLSVIAMQIWAVVDLVKILKGEINTDGNGNLIKMGF